MGKCEVCGNEYNKVFELIAAGALLCALRSAGQFSRREGPGSLTFGQQLSQGASRAGGYDCTWPM